jgi:glycerol-3-phosphate dehydrogenase (NAD(P)+)
MLYGRSGSEKLAEFQSTRTNGLITLDKNIELTDNLEQTVNHAEIIIISIASQSLRSLMGQLANYDLSEKSIVLCMKGIEVKTGKRLTQIVEEFVPNTHVAIWVGPGHVQDFLSGIPNCMVIDGRETETKQKLVKALSSDLIRFYYGDDLIGNEIGAAAKNVIGIAAGMLDGLNKTALKGALMSRGTREIARLIKAKGGNEITAYGLSHLGDYQATVFSEFSHNRRFGELFVQGKQYGELAEGVATTTALLKMGDDCGVELPICKAVNAVLNLGEEPGKVLGDLFLRSLKMEF